MSHPSRVRGLKQSNETLAGALWKKVAPFTGAWIETKQLDENYKADIVAPFTGAWIETMCITSWRLVARRRTLHGCVD